MLFRVVYVMASVLAVLPVNATALDSENKQTYQLASNSDVSYQPWPGSPSMVKHDSVPPPPPGPYLSSGLSDLPSTISNHADRNQQTPEISKTSPLIRPDAPWPGQRLHPTMWKPEGEVAYAPNNNSVPPNVNRMSPPINMQPPRMYSQPNPQGNFVRPQFNQPRMNQRQMNQPRMNQRQMNQPQMNQQQAMQQQMYQQRLKQQQMRQQQMNQQRRNQQAPVWNDFSMPMSNYPRQGQRARPPIPR